MSQPKTLFRRGGRSGPAPSSVRWAVWLLLAGVLLQLVDVFEIVLEGNPNVIFAVSETIGIALPVVLAHRVSLSHRWARTAVWILAAAVTAATLAGAPWNLAQVPFTILAVSPLVGASVLLAMPGSNQYFGRT